MKKTLALFLVYAFSSMLGVFTLNALFFRSNELGQRLEVLDALSKTAYCLEVSEENCVLFFDGNRVKTFETSLTDDTVTEIERDIRSGTVSIKQYRNGLLVREELSGTEKVKRVYGYTDGRLSFVSVFFNGSQTPSYTDFFLRSSSRGSLAAVKRGDSIRLLSDDYVVQNGLPYKEISKGLIFRDNYDVLEDGSVRIEADGKVLIYSKDGLLTRTEDGESLSTYSYSYGVITSMETVRNNERNVILYEKGIPVKTMSYSANELTSETLHRAGGNIQKLYSNGRLVATVYYKADNRTVDRIEYK
ncbi:MAG: hypothetical protein ACTTJW_08210 [Sphaerochaeta sp.]